MDTFEPLPPIPTPPAQRWKEFRVQFLPLIVFVLAVVAVVLLWNHTIQPMGVVGEVEITSTDVVSPEVGRVVELTVDRFSEVREGQVLGYIEHMDSQLTEATRALGDSESRIEQINLTISDARRKLDTQQLKLDLQRERTELASSLPLLLATSNQFVRTEQLLGTNGSVSKADYDTDLAAFEAVQAAITSRQHTIADLETFLRETENAEAMDVPAAIAATRAAFGAELDSLRRSALIAPIDGMVNSISNRLGERVQQGETILTITAPESQRIVGYIRQPIFKYPSIGASVIVRKRSRPPVYAEAQIVGIGAQIEPISPTMLAGDQTATTTIISGLPILVSLPKELALLPGELVDLTIEYPKN